MRYYLYVLTFPDGKKYIGYTARLRGRFAVHKHAAKDPKTRLHAAITKHGMPIMSVLCIGTRDYMVDLEKRAIIAFQTYNAASGHNIYIGHGPAGRAAWNRGIPRTAKERAAIKAALAKSEAFVAVRQRIGGWNKGVPNSDEHRAKTGVAIQELIWITNDLRSQRIKKDDPIPQGWRKGRHWSSRNRR